MEATKTLPPPRPFLMFSPGERTPGAPREPDAANAARLAALAEVEGCPPSKSERAKHTTALFGRPVGIVLEAMDRARALAQAGSHAQAAAAATDAAKLSADPFGGVVATLRFRRAAYEAWEKSDHAKQLQAATAARDAAALAFGAVEGNEDVSRKKQARLRDELDNATRRLNSLMNSDDPAFVELRHALRATGDPGMPATDWRSIKI